MKFAIEFGTHAKQVDNLRAQLAGVHTGLTEANEEVNNLQDQRAELQGKLKQFEDDALNLGLELATHAKEADKLRAQLAELEQTLAESNQNATKLAAEGETHAREAEKLRAERAQLKMELTESNKHATMLAAEVETQAKEAKKLRDQLAELEERLLKSNEYVMKFTAETVKHAKAAAKIYLGIGELQTKLTIELDEAVKPHMSRSCTTSWKSSEPLTAAELLISAYDLDLDELNSLIKEVNDIAERPASYSSSHYEQMLKNIVERQASYIKNLVKENTAWSMIHDQNSVALQEGVGRLTRFHDFVISSLGHFQQEHQQADSIYEEALPACEDKAVDGKVHSELVSSYEERLKENGEEITNLKEQIRVLQLKHTAAGE